MKELSEDLHIDAPELLTSSERARDTLFTALMWAVYLYLWVPLVSLFAWLLGFEFAYDVMIRTGGARDLGAILLVYGVIVVVIFITVMAWSLGNKLRYGKLKRRHAHKVVSTEELAEFFGVTEDSATELRELPLVAIEFDDEGLPVITPGNRTG
jgi:biofilm PGA synthesis protein PgaD